MVSVEYAALRDLGKRIEENIGGDIDKALELLTKAREIEHSNFTAVVPRLAVAYVGAVEFTEEQLKCRRNHLKSIDKNLNANATAWEEADAKSTFQDC